MKSQGDYYDPDEDVRSSSPGLVPTKVNYKPEESPPPYVLTSSSPSPSPDPDDSKANRLNGDASARLSGKRKHKRKRRKGRTRPSQGDAVLITHLDPNRPDIARQIGEEALNSASQSEAGDGGGQDMRSGGDDDDDENGRIRAEERDIPHTTKLTDTAVAALDMDMSDSAPEAPAVSTGLARLGTEKGAVEQGVVVEDVTKSTILNGLQGSNALSRSRQPSLPLTIMAASLAPHTKVEAESIISASPLARYAIPAAQANPESTLPAMQKSSPRFMAGNSPDGTQSLPSIETALSQLADKQLVDTPNGASPFSQSTGPSPSLTRAPFLTGNSGPSPSAYSNPSPASSKDMATMSPPGYPHPSNYWRGASKEGSHSAPSPASVPSVSSGTGYSLTPKEIVVSPESVTAPQILHGPFNSTTFKCTHPGCTASPFQTQYLLTSHANVHSSSRPHYCPVTSCSRSLGGKGFKRKNEMIRHGLVHQSPGYMCPFCAEQQHKYPRPDNLQRHVRQHHPDKKRDDPQLRSVLALRSGGEGAGRGRRRRSGA